MITNIFEGVDISSLGLGNMRLPVVEAGSNVIDRPGGYAIIDYAYNHGINYFDTAYIYNGGDSEKTVGECMKKYDRDSFYIATKFNYNANPDYKAVFEEQLQRLQTDRIDFYLIHCILKSNVDAYMNCGCIEYFEEQRRLGRIKYLGFSNHADVETLKKFADCHKWDFAQLQINWYDWYSGTAKEEYEVLAERNIPAVVMEPVRGGRLATLTPQTEAILREAHPDWSNAAWALRFVRSLPNVFVTLSGMSNMDQITENINTFEDDTPFTEEDQATLKRAYDVFASQVQVPCTACRYCTDGCPVQINIPEYLKFLNAYKLEGPWGLDGVEKVESVGRPADCIGCGACMQHCPQGIEIPTRMGELADAMEAAGK